MRKLCSLIYYYILFVASQLAWFVCCKPAVNIMSSLTVGEPPCVQNVHSCIYSIQSTHNLHCLFAASWLWILRGIDLYPQPAGSKQYFLSTDCFFLQCVDHASARFPSLPEDGSVFRYGSLVSMPVWQNIERGVRTCRLSEQRPILLAMDL